jgi:sulfur carrier protein
MELTINNQKKQFTLTHYTIQSILDIEMPTKQNGIAVAVNNKVVSKTSWDDYILLETDDILIISATQGG